MLSITAMVFRFVFAIVRAAFRSHHDIIIENALLRLQLAAFKKKRPRPTLNTAHRAFWVSLRHAWARWTDALILVKPDTVVRWHRMGFRLY